MIRKPGITILFVCSMFAAAAVAHQGQPPKPKQPPKQQTPKPKQGSEPRQSAAAAKALEQYSFTCQPCHGPEGKGVFPDTDLTSGKWKHGSSLEAIAKTISEGVPGTAMVPAKDRFSKAEILELARLVRSFDKTLSGKKPVKK
jgi:mono/diheme cytochrome c family protein